MAYEFSITSWIQAIFHNPSPLSNIYLKLLGLNCNKITFKWTMGHIPNLTNSSYQYTHLHKAMVIQINNHYLLFENYIVLTCNKMCLWNINAPNNGQFQRWLRSQGHSNILIPVEKSHHKKCSCAIWNSNTYYLEERTNVNYFLKSTSKVKVTG